MLIRQRKYSEKNLGLYYHLFPQKEKKLENFGGHMFSEDDHSYWAPPYWNITKDTFLGGRTEL